MIWPWSRPASRSAWARAAWASPHRGAGRDRPMLVRAVLARLFFDRVEVTAEFIDNVVSGWLATLRRRYDHCE
jgi:hypothetical protein